MTDKAKPLTLTHCADHTLGGIPVCSKCATASRATVTALEEAQRERDEKERQRYAAKVELDALRLQFDQRIARRVAELEDEQARWFTEHLNDERDDIAAERDAALARVKELEKTIDENRRALVAEWDKDRARVAELEAALRTGLIALAHLNTAADKYATVASHDRREALLLAMLDADTAFRAMDAALSPKVKP